MILFEAFSKLPSEAAWMQSIPGSFQALQPCARPGHPKLCQPLMGSSAVLEYVQEGQKGPQAEPGQELGPESELAFWRARAVKLNSITEQLKTPACRSVLAVTGAARSKQYKAWRKMDVEVGQFLPISSESACQAASLVLSCVHTTATAKACGEIL